MQVSTRTVLAWAIVLLSFTSLASLAPTGRVNDPTTAAGVHSSSGHPHRSHVHTTIGFNHTQAIIAVVLLTVVVISVIIVLVCSWTEGKICFGDPTTEKEQPVLKGVLPKNPGAREMADSSQLFPGGSKSAQGSKNNDSKSSVVTAKSGAKSAAKSATKSAVKSKVAGGSLTKTNARSAKGQAKSKSKVGKSKTKSKTSNASSSGVKSKAPSKVSSKAK